jgi:hypothetical protein
VCVHVCVFVSGVAVCLCVCLFFYCVFDYVVEYFPGLSSFSCRFCSICRQKAWVSEW